MKGCILDQRSFDQNDIDITPLLDQLEGWRLFNSSTDEEVDERIAGCEVVITNKVRIGRSSIEKAGNLKLVMLAATGTDNVDLQACSDRGIVVCNARQYSNPAVVQHTFTLMLCLMTSVISYREDVRAGAWSASDIFCLLDHPIRELQGKTLGIIGFGNLGSAVSRVAEAFGMRILLCQRPGNSANTEGRVSLDELLKHSDVITLHCPLTPETRHLLSRKQFAKMKNEAVLINTARGAIVDAEALADALRNGEIAGAGIDVLDQEPPTPEHPLLAKDIPNLILTPHNAWGTRESRQRLVTQMADNLAGWLAGTVRNQVN